MMDTLDLTALPLVGALQVDHGEHGVQPHRLPEWARRQSTEPMLGLVSSMPAGVRLAMHTNATSIELAVDLQLIKLAGGPPVPAVFDLVVDGDLAGSVSTIEGTTLELDPAGQVVVTPGPATTIRFDDLSGDAAARTEIWLPHAAAVRLAAVRVSPGAHVAAIPSAAPRWIHYGSSISHCVEASSPTRTWPNAVALRTGWDLHNLGLAGQCMLDPFVGRVIRDLEADAISLKLGINVFNGDTFRERTFVPALHGFLDTLREGHPRTPVVVISSILFAAGEDAPGPTLLRPDGRYGTAPRTAELSNGALSLGRIRELLGIVLETRQDTMLHFLDGRTLFGPDDVEDLYDGLHPNADGYLRMADRFYEQVCAPGRFLSSLVARVA